MAHQQPERSLFGGPRGRPDDARSAAGSTSEEKPVPFIVNSSPGPGLRFEPSETLASANDALAWAGGLSRRGMRLIRIRDTETGAIFDEKSLREEVRRLQSVE
jgi:hypothetical protein